LIGGLVAGGWLIHLLRLRYGLTAMVWAARSQIIIGVIRIDEPKCNEIDSWELFKV
jgi:hypothetical protein